MKPEGVISRVGKPGPRWRRVCTEVKITWNVEIPGLGGHFRHMASLASSRPRRSDANSSFSSNTKMRSLPAEILAEYNEVP